MSLSRSHRRFCWLLLVAMAWSAPVAQAQLVPDVTLGDESSSISTDQRVQGDLADVVEGGAARGSNLFHSFSEFNVNDGQRVYFANPAEIESILSRVTGNSPSEIFGTLGVNGPADLFLINPYGLVFGENAQLDIPGSFYGTTAEAVEIGDGVFSATVPEQSQLIAVSPSVSFWNYLTENSGTITNRGVLAVGGDLVLAGNGLDLKNQVAAVGNVSLLATDGVKIRDTTDVPFVTFAGEELLVQGNQQVDIIALGHPDSGLFSYGDMILRSAERIGGDAHYFSIGSFRVEQLGGSGGELFSPIDPIIRSFGDVVIDGYAGSSLHILAGGSVTLGTATIIGADDSSVGADFLQETIILTDGTKIEVNGREQPTLDIRAGVSLEKIGVPPLEILTGFDPVIDFFVGNAFETGFPSTSDITVGDVQMNAPNGLVLLTNQYFPNVALPNGNISITAEGFYEKGIDARGFFGQGGAVYADARSNFSVVNGYINVVGLNNVGDILIIAGDDVIFDGADGSRATGAFANLATGLGSSGDISVTATNLKVLNGARINSLLFGSGEGGNVTLDIEETIHLEGRNPLSGRASGVSSGIEANGGGTGGRVQMTARNLNVLNGAQIATNTLGLGDAGSLILTIQETARFEGINISNGRPSGASSGVGQGGQGQGGNMQITARNLEVLNGAQLSASTAGTGNAGDMILKIDASTSFEGVNLFDGKPSGAFSSIQTGGNGEGGDVQIIARHLSVLDGAQVFVGTFGAGNAGNIALEIEETVRFEGTSRINGNVSKASSSVEPGGEGRGGDIQVTARNLDLLNGAQLNAITFGLGDAGNVILEIEETVHLEGADPNGTSSGVFSQVNISGKGQGGDIRIAARDLDVLHGAQLNTVTLGVGNAGNVILEIEETAHFEGANLADGNSSGVFSQVDLGGTGRGGSVEITARNLNVLNGAQLSASTFGVGNAGNVILSINETAYFEGINLIDGTSSGVYSSVSLGGFGPGGDIQITAADLFLRDGAGLSAASSGLADAGNILLDIQNRIEVLDGTFEAATQLGAGGQIQIDAGNIFLFGDSDIQTFVNSGADNGGDITITADAVVALDDSDILAFAADGRGGNVDLSQTAFFGQDFSLAPFGTDPRTLDGNNRVDINATGRLASGNILLPDVSFIQNTLTELPDNLVNPETLVSNSCIARSNDTASSFTLTGSDGLPSDSPQPSYSLSNVQPTTDPTNLEQDTSVIEPHRVYQLSDGRLVMSRECNEMN